MNITIAEPVTTNEVEIFKPEVATRTREKLAEIFNLGEQVSEGVVTPLSKSILSNIKSDVHSQADEILNRVGLDPEYPLEAVFSIAGAAVRAIADSGDARKYSYAMEYATGWMRKVVHSKSLTAYPVDTANLVAVGMAPRGTTSQCDRTVRPMSGGSLGHFLYQLEDWFGDAGEKLRDFCGCAGWKQFQSTFGSAWSHENILGVIYTEEDVAWFAGFITVEDYAAMKFSRIRVGALVKQLTKSDTKAQEAADRFRSLYNFDLVLHPNDRSFGAEYRSMYERNTDELGSCMTANARGYGAPFGVHPCDVYSTSLYGQEDNGLVLVEAQFADKPVGRGILNVKTKQIVRWYGEHKAMVMLRNVFGIHEDTDALDDVRLALIREGNKIAAPYLDGDQNVRITEDDKLYVGSGCRDSFDFEMDDTSGYQYCTEMQYCAITEERYPVEDLEYQEISETYVHPSNCHSSYRCAITGEYFDPYNLRYVYINGSEELVWDGVRMEDYDYTNLGGNIGWTRDEDEYTYDDVTGQYYPNDEYEELVAERELENEEEDDAEAA